MNQDVDGPSNACCLSDLSVKNIDSLNYSFSLNWIFSNLLCCFVLVQEEHSWGSGSRGQGPGSPSPEEGASPGGRLERTPSFTAEWEEVRR